VPAAIFNILQLITLARQRLIAQNSATPTLKQLVDNVIELTVSKAQDALLKRIHLEISSDGAGAFNKKESSSEVQSTIYPDVFLLQNFFNLGH
jgi:hypothetical protein